MTSQGQRFRRRALRRGYKVDEVDNFLDRVEATLNGDRVDAPVRSQEVHDVVFRVRFGGYDEWQVDLHLDRVERQLADQEPADFNAGMPGDRLPDRMPDRMPERLSQERLPERIPNPGLAGAGMAGMAFDRGPGSMADRGMGSVPGGMPPGALPPGPSGIQPSGIQPGGMQPGGIQPGGMQPGGMGPGGTGPGGMPDRGMPDRGMPDRGQPDRGIPDRGMSERGLPGRVPAPVRDDRMTPPGGDRPSAPTGPPMGGPPPGWGEAPTTAHPGYNRPEYADDPYDNEPTFAGFEPGRRARPDLTTEMRRPEAAPAGYPGGPGPSGPGLGGPGLGGPGAGGPGSGGPGSGGPNANGPGTYGSGGSGPGTYGSGGSSGSGPGGYGPNGPGGPGVGPGGQAPAGYGPGPGAAGPGGPGAGGPGPSLGASGMSGNGMSGPPGSGGSVPPGDVQRIDQLRRTFQLRRFGSGYDRAEVDRLFEGVIASMSGRSSMSFGDSELDPQQFNLVPGGYFESEVDQALREVRDIMRRR